MFIATFVHGARRLNVDVPAGTRDLAIAWMRINHPDVGMFRLRRLRPHRKGGGIYPRMIAMDETGMGAHLPVIARRQR